MNVKKEGPFKISDKKRSSSIIKTQVGNLSPDRTVFIAMQIANFCFQLRGQNSLLTFLNWNFDIYMVLCHELLKELLFKKGLFFFIGRTGQLRIRQTCPRS